MLTVEVPAGVTHRSGPGAKVCGVCHTGKEGHPFARRRSSTGQLRASGKGSGRRTCLRRSSRNLRRSYRCLCMVSYSRSAPTPLRRIGQGPGWMESSTLQPGPLSTRLKSQGALASPSVENGSPGTLPGIPARSNAEFADLGDELTVARRARGHHPHAYPSRSTREARGRGCTWTAER